MRVTLTGGSMRPYLQAGDTAEVHEIPASALHPGDIVAYRVGGKLLLHRFARAGRGGLWVFDDAATIGWHKIEPACVVGRLKSGCPLSCGLSGLLYGLTASTIFACLRPLFGNRSHDSSTAE
ncbi:MAG: S24/S26 family peptidase [Elusimicrobiota bacterium]